MEILYIHHPPYHLVMCDGLWTSRRGTRRRQAQGHPLIGHKSFPITCASLMLPARHSCICNLLHCHQTTLGTAFHRLSSRIFIPFLICNPLWIGSKLSRTKKRSSSCPWEKTKFSSRTQCKASSRGISLMSLCKMVKSVYMPVPVILIMMLNFSPHFSVSSAFRRSAAHGISSAYGCRIFKTFEQGRETKQRDCWAGCLLL